MEDALLKKGKKFLKSIDFVVDLNALTFVWVNEKTAKKLGYTAKEMLKIRPQDILDFGGIFNQMRLMKLMHQPEGEIDWNVTKKDGSQVTIYAKFHNLEHDGGTYHFTQITKMD